MAAEAAHQADSEDLELVDPAVECSADHQELLQELHQDQPPQLAQAQAQEEDFSVVPEVSEQLWLKALLSESEVELPMLP